MVVFFSLDFFYWVSPSLVVVVVVVVVVFDVVVVGSNPVSIVVYWVFTQCGDP